MTSKEINQELEKIYLTELSELLAKEKLKDAENLSCPLIPHIFEEYFSTEKKIVFIGKETHSWGLLDSLRNSPAQDALQIIKSWYINFNFGININDNKYSFNSAFWRFCHTINKKINNNNKNYRNIVWLNQARLDQNSTTPNKDCFEEILSWSFDLLHKELNILKPDVVVIMGNGYYYDSVKRMFENNLKYKIDYQTLGNKEFSGSVCSIDSNFFDPNTKVYWCRHPERKSSEEIAEMINKIEA